MVWAFDRVLRLGRVLWNNRIWSHQNPDHALASLELLSEDTIRLTMHRQFTWKAGQHAYLTLPSISKLPTEAHPFTIASIPDRKDSGDVEVVFIIRGRTGFTGLLRDHVVHNGLCKVPARVDGPYGCPPDLRSFSTCVLVAGQQLLN